MNDTMHRWHESTAFYITLVSVPCLGGLLGMILYEVCTQGSVLPNIALYASKALGLVVGCAILYRICRFALIGRSSEGKRVLKISLVTFAANVGLAAIYLAFEFFI